MPAGRPSLYDPKYCEEVVRLGSEGMSLSEMALEMGIARSTLQKWGAEYEEFSAALNESNAAAQGWWEAKGRMHLENRDFNQGLWKMNMGPRFRHDWTETVRNEHSGPGGGPQRHEVKHTVSPEAQSLLDMVSPAKAVESPVG